MTTTANWHPKCLAEAIRQSNTRDNAPVTPTPKTLNESFRRFWSRPETRLQSAPLSPEAAKIITTKPVTQEKTNEQ
jgi:hypothetical protein